MSLSKISYHELDRALKKFFSARLVEDTCNLLRDRVLDSSNLETDLFVPNGVRFKCRKLNEKILLGLLQYYVDDSLRVLINLWLEENWGQDFKEIKHCLITSKELALGAILVSDRWNERDFFGNVLTQNNLKFLRQSTVLRRPSCGPKRAVRRRGYQDHGSMRLPHESEPAFDERKYLSVSELEIRRFKQRQEITSFVEDVLKRLVEEGLIA